ncbi:MAG: plasmid recombination protein, partial [Lachnospiraceae bacterium]|nr:plasmid recombination protein [Ruminococcus sp.]MCM1277228.1 plasmid recombination protein [Lachnospiraceae bacterium]
MDAKNGKQISISFRVDEGVVEHNNRDFIAKNVDKERIGDNIVYRREDLREFYQKLFGQALTDYNASKKRPYQRIPDYYEHIKNGKQEKLFEEIVVQFGDMETCGLKSGKWEEAKLMLDDFMKSFERRNPNLKVFNAIMHLDEATPHLHIDFVPICTNQTRGLSTRVSMSGALREQGFTSASKMQNEWAAWEERERDVMTDILRAHDLSRDVKNDTHAHLTVDEYKQREMKKAEIRKLNAHINELKKKNPTELTEDEIELIKNQNDFMRSEILSYRDNVAALSRKVGAKFIPLEIFSEDKLQFVAAELEKANIPFVEENCALHIPDYARKTAAAIAATFRPNKVEGVREKIKLEIDRLIYSSANLEDLLNKLKMHGYQIKNGKHLAVKPTFAERFVRLKT